MIMLATMTMPSMTPPRKVVLNFNFLSPIVVLFVLSLLNHVLLVPAPATSISTSGNFSLTALFPPNTTVVIAADVTAQVLNLTTTSPNGGSPSAGTTTSSTTTAAAGSSVTGAWNTTTAEGGAAVFML